MRTEMAATRARCEAVATQTRPGKGLFGAPSRDRHLDLQARAAAHTGRS